MQICYERHGEHPTTGLRCRPKSTLHVMESSAYNLTEWHSEGGFSLHGENEAGRTRGCSRSSKPERNSFQAESPRLAQRDTRHRTRHAPLAGCWRRSPSLLRRCCCHRPPCPGIPGEKHGVSVKQPAAALTGPKLHETEVQVMMELSAQGLPSGGQRLCHTSASQSVDGRKGLERSPPWGTVHPDAPRARGESVWRPKRDTLPPKLFVIEHKLT